MIVRCILATIGSGLINAGLARVVFALTDDPSAKTGVVFMWIGTGIVIGLLIDRRKAA